MSMAKLTKPEREARKFDCPTCNIVAGKPCIDLRFKGASRYNAFIHPARFRAKEIRRTQMLAQARFHVEAGKNAMARAAFWYKAARSL